LRKFFLGLSLLTLTASLFAADEPKPAPIASPAENAFLQAALTQCTGAKVGSSKFERAFPTGFQAQVISVESDDPECKNEALEVTAPDGRRYVGFPWFLDKVEGTAAEKVKKFTWDSFHENFEAGATAKSSDPVFSDLTVYHVTEFGRIPMQGVVDRNAQTFYLGRFYKTPEEIRADRLKMLTDVIAKAPTRGPKDARVTVIEFSDFQCPSCRHAAEFMKPILEKHPNDVKYIRVDFPLVSSHPWAFGAAVIGRAIYRQNPDAFWAYKKAIYDSQSEMNLFMLEDFGKNFVSDHSLDAKRYEADITSEAIKQEILDSAGAAFSVQVQSTPTYMVNGQFVAAGHDGSRLAEYVDSLLKK
jgi:protein-disulfide isomerase